MTIFLHFVMLRAIIERDYNFNVENSSIFNYNKNEIYILVATDFNYLIYNSFYHKR